MLQAFVSPMRGRRTMARPLHVIFDRFLLFPLGAIIALVWANTAAESYFTFAHRFAFIVNEIGMAFFFALVAQEVVEATMPGGALHSWRKWTMPFAAAIGGIVGATGAYLGYVQLCYEQVLTSAWPIVCGIDAAATYYLLRTILPRSGALPFALLLAIVTDVLGAFIVAPQRWALETQAGAAALLAVAVGIAALMRSARIRSFWPYLLICGTLSWLAFYWEGLHPAFALVPIVPFLMHEPRKLDLFADPPDDDAVHHAEHEWHLWVQPIVFLFGLVNAGVVLRGYGTGSWGMLIAALAGRPAGILIAIALASAAGLHLPRHVGWREVLVVAFATSSGFAVALFFATGVLATGPLLAEIKIGILLSVCGAFLAVAAARVLKVGRFAR
jgi:NhaA family Na+:H+ antiporter